MILLISLVLRGGRMSKKKKGYDPLDDVLNLGAVSGGSMIVGSLPGMINSPISDRVSGAMGKTLPILPLTVGVGSVFRSMGNLVDVERKIKKDRR